MKQNWKNKQQQAFDDGMVVLPPEVNGVLIGAQMDLEFLQPTWEVCLLNVSAPPNMPEIAAGRGGDVDRVSGLDAVRLPNDSYLVKFNDERVGVMRPAHRQSVAKWLASTDRSGGTPRLSAYLQGALSYATKSGTPIILAMDLTDTVSEESVQKRLTQLKSLKGETIDLPSESKSLASIRGVTLGITINERVFGKLKVDFGKNTGISADLGKKIILEILEKHGAMINEFDTWKSEKTENQITLEGYLYPSGLRRVLSVVEVPQRINTQKTASPGESLADGGSNGKIAMLASKQYFKSIDGYLDDIRRKKGEIQSWGQAGIWMSRYARKIDELSMVNVDAEMLDYGAFVSGALRQASDSLRGIAGNTRVRELNSPAVYNSYGRWGAFGGYVGYQEDLKSEQQERNRIGAEERIGGTTSARGVFDEIDSATGSIRRRMAEKFKENF